MFWEIFNNNKKNGQNVRDVPSNKWSRLSVDFLLENLLIDNIKEICFLQSTKGSDPSLWYLQSVRVNRNRCGTATSIRQEEARKGVAAAATEIGNWRRLPPTAGSSQLGAALHNCTTPVISCWTEEVTCVV